MFSAVYLVCILNEPCTFFVDKVVYPSEEVCLVEALNIIELNKLRAARGEAPPHTSEFQCVSWNKA